jgi:hypothetical protein
MAKFDIGVEGHLKFRINRVEAQTGEQARDEIQKRFQEFIGPDSKIQIERTWFQPSKD